jgi:Invasion associated locus B (IalB) protein
MFNKNLTIVFLIGWLYCQNIFAQELHATYVEWSVFSTVQGKNKICYMAALPVKKEGNYNKRGEPYFLIINNDDGFDEVSVSSGYNYKKNSEVEISFGLKKFSIFTYNNLAWANDRTDDIEIVKAMRLSRDFIVSGTSIDNSYSQDTYSLIGFMEAYHKMKKVCEPEDKPMDILP